MIAFLLSGASVGGMYRLGGSHDLQDVRHYAAYSVGIRASSKFIQINLLDWLPERLSGQFVYRYQYIPGEQPDRRSSARTP